MRMIDGDRLLRELTALSHGQVWPGWTYEGIRLLIERQPTLTPPNEWVSVEEKLPPPKQNVLAYSTRSGIAEADYADGVWMQYRWSAVMESVTHWMPLPEPPEKENDGR